MMVNWDDNKDDDPYTNVTVFPLGQTAQFMQPTQSRPQAFIFSSR